MTDPSQDSVVRGRNVLVTGGTGFLGRALVRRLVALRPRKIRIVSQSEARRSQFQQMLRGADVPLAFVTGDIADPFVVRRAMDGAQVVFHLAAMKHVDFCEGQPYQAVKTNVLGSKTLLDAALREPRLECFIAVSSDKAANPVGVYGMTKALMERMICEAQAESGGRFAVVRCGNFWGSTASVVPIWLRNVREGRELHVTDPRMTRFVILSQEGVDLLLYAAQRGSRGEIVARAMPVYELGDLAAVFSERYGVAARVVGTRPGEKLHEDLISAMEAPFTRRDGDEFVITPGRPQDGTKPFSSADALRLTKEQLVHLLSAEEVAAA